MLYVILGQTASGKTALATKLARELSLPLLNCDAFQCYKEMNIGNAKPTEEELTNVEYYFIDNLPIDEELNVRKFQIEGRKIIDEILKENKDIIISGGTNLYIKALLFNYDFPEIDNSLLDELDKLLLEDLLTKLKELDVDTYERIDKNNKRRVVTALALAISNHSRSKIEDKFINKTIYPCLFFNIDIDKEEINEKINNRVDNMFSNNLLIDEINKLSKKYDISKLHSFTAIGYKEFLPYIDKNTKEVDLTKLSEIKELIKLHTRQYAKRQRTFIRTQFNNVKTLSSEDIYKHIYLDVNMKQRTKLLLNSKQTNNLEKLNVLICGLGGVGSMIPNYLVRLGVKNISILDNDTVSISNLNRQLMYELDSLNKKKTDVVKEKLIKTNPNVEVKTYDIFLNKETMETQLSDICKKEKYDVIFDCIDSIEGKAYLTKYALENNIMIIVSGGAGKKLDSTKTKYINILKSNDKLIKAYLEYLKTLSFDFNLLKDTYCIESIEPKVKNESKTISSIVTTPNSFGLAMISLLLNKYIDK